jgi:coenzyme F420-dependent glucose-6-phosphate dehydrogenase
MIEIGYKLSSEEFGPADLVRFAKRAEDAGFGFALVSDHFHPWTDRQGESPFVWTVAGAVAQATTRLRLGTAVTCPTIRVHPAIVAQAAATTAALMKGRFFLGVGTGENLNEHVVGRGWPSAEVRLEMLEEAIGVIRALWTGDLTSHHGDHYTVENARIYSLPPELPRIHVAGSAPRMARLAGKIGDGFIGTGPERKVVEAYRSAGGDGPRFGQVTLCWSRSVDEARRTAFEWWPTAAIRGNASQELALPKDFEDLAGMVDEDAVAKSVVCAADERPILEAIEKYVDAGYDHVYLHQVGPDQQGFLEFAERSILPAFERRPAEAAGATR